MHDSNAKSSPERLQQFVALYTRHARRIYTYLLTLLPNRADADEVFQEVGAILWEKFDSYTDGTNFAAWACRVAYFQALKHRKRRLPQLFSDLLLDSFEEDWIPVDESLDAEYHALAECFGKLKPSDREMIELRYAEGGTPQRIAEQLQRPLVSVYKSLARVRKALFDCVQRAMPEEPLA